MLIEDGRVYERSDAVVRIARGLSGPARAAAALRILPRPARDLLYKGVARSRYRLFGRRETCRVPTLQSAPASSRLGSGRWFRRLGEHPQGNLALRTSVP